MSSSEEDTVEIVRKIRNLGEIVAEAFDDPGLSVAALTNVGRVRRTNEDQFAIVRRTRQAEVLASSLAEKHLPGELHFAWLLAVADGLGGHVSGEIASATAMSTILNFANNLSSWVMKPTDGLREDFKERVELYASAIQTQLREQAATNPALAGMATTVTAAYIYGDSALLVNLGDSRSYLIRSGNISQITRDHTLGRDLQETGLPPEATRPYRNILTRCFNTGGADVDIDLFHLDLEQGDQILLCSDGLTDMVSDRQILDLIRSAETVKLASERLVEAALRNGGRDNVTVVLAQVQDPAT